ncbi:hypothetical protein Bca52824_034760 [Brassica carinata]|uniref:Uncharacterized protein n=1 Tax=Brassica carinata TaxID=52824 RepID=A0A8X7S1X3_BRACI|nr:hypothetical protein Bca52824_034760 [Brassica carinata]
MSSRVENQGSGTPIVAPTSSDEVSAFNRWLKELEAGYRAAATEQLNFAADGLVVVTGLSSIVSPNKSGFGLDVGVLVVPVRVLPAPLSPAASSEFSLVSVLSASGEAILWRRVPGQANFTGS